MTITFAVRGEYIQLDQLLKATGLCESGGAAHAAIAEGRVRVLGPISRAHVTAEEEALGYTLACRVAPTVAVRLEVAGRLAKPISKGFAAQANHVLTK